jgi:hypothetical protein
MSNEIEIRENIDFAIKDAVILAEDKTDQLIKYIKKWRKLEHAIPLSIDRFNGIFTRGDAKNNDNVPRYFRRFFARNGIYIKKIKNKPKLIIYNNISAPFVASMFKSN